RYTSDLHRALVSLLNRDIGLARSALRRQIPAGGQRDMRGPEWAALWNEAAGGDMRVYGKIGSPPIREAALSPDHRLLAVYAGERRGRVTIWNLETGEQRELAGDAQDLVGFNAEGAAVIVHTARGGLVSCDLEGRASDETPPLPGQIIHSAAQAGTILVTERLTADPVVGIWDLASRSQTMTWKPDDPRSQKRLSSAAKSPVSDVIAVSTYLADDPTAAYSLQVWSHASGWTRVMERLDFFHLETIEFSPDASRLAVAGPSNDLTLIDIATGKNALEMPGHKGNVFDTEFSPDGRWLASAGEDQTIRIWSLANGACAAILRGHEGSVTTVTWLSPDLLVSTGTDGTARLWNREPPSRVPASRQFWRGFLGDFIYAPDSGTIFATMADGRIGEFNTHNLARTGRAWDALHPVALRDGVLWALTADLTLARCELATGAVV
ncbi:MAG: WD40 repeat domain-containing protein, partial [Opitutaceae bacterium]